MSTRSIGDVAELLRGVTYGKNDATESTAPDALPLLRATNITEAGLWLADLVFIPARLAKPEQRVQQGDIVMTMSSGSASVVGRSILVHEPIDATFGAFCGVLRASDQVLDRYLSYMIRAPQVRQCWSDLARGTNINNLKREDVLQTAILVPPLAEQQRIVAKLDEVDAGLRTLSERLDTELLRSAQVRLSATDNLVSRAGGKKMTLGEVLSLEYGKPLDRSKRDPSAAVPVYGANGVKAFTKKALYSEPTIVVGRKGSAGALVFVNEPCWPLDVTYYVVHDHDETDLKFLHILLQSLDLPRLAKGVKPGINRNEAYALECLLPSLAEQESITAKFEELQSACAEVSANIERRKAKAGELQQSVLAAAFRGDL